MIQFLTWIFWYFPISPRWEKRNSSNFIFFSFFSSSFFPSSTSTWLSPSDIDDIFQTNGDYFRSEAIRPRLRLRMGRNEEEVMRSCLNVFWQPSRRSSKSVQQIGQRGEYSRTIEQTTTLLRTVSLLTQMQKYGFKYDGRFWTWIRYISNEISTYSNGRNQRERNIPNTYIM